MWSYPIQSNPIQSLSNPIPIQSYPIPIQSYPIPSNPTRHPSMSSVPVEPLQRRTESRDLSDESWNQYKPLDSDRKWLTLKSQWAISRRSLWKGSFQLRSSVDFGTHFTKSDGPADGTRTESVRLLNSSSGSLWKKKRLAQHCWRGNGEKQYLSSLPGNLGSELFTRSFTWIEKR